jgi:hypothetical protein
MEEETQKRISEKILKLKKEIIEAKNVKQVLLNTAVLLSSLNIPLSFLFENKTKDGAIIVSRYLMPLTTFGMFLYYGLVNYKKTLYDNSLKMAKLTEKYKQVGKDSPILLIGGVDSIGVPYTRDNKLNLSFFDIVRAYFESHTNIRTIEMYSMSTYNTTDYINWCIKNNPTLERLKINLREGIDCCRKANGIQYIKLPKKTKKLYRIDDYDGNTNFTDELIKGTPVFIYSCGLNDLLKDIGTNLRNRKEIKRLLSKDIKGPIYNTMEKIDENITELTKVNPQIEIYVIGLYIPTRYSYIRNRLAPFIEDYNKALEELCSNHDNVHYVDNSNINKQEIAPFDWHLNSRGQKHVGKNIINQMEKNKVLTKFKRDIN